MMAISRLLYIAVLILCVIRRFKSMERPNNCAENKQETNKNKISKKILKLNELHRSKFDLDSTEPYYGTEGLRAIPAVKIFTPIHCSFSVLPFLRI